MTQTLKNNLLSRYGFGPKAMRKAKLCPNCATLVTDGAKACPACGHAMPKLTLLSWYEQQHPKCIHCRTVLRENTLFCPHCGRSRNKL